MVGDAVILHLQTERLPQDRGPVHSGGHNAAADTVWILDQDFVTC
jgi:hypothetical protein